MTAKETPPPPDAKAPLSDWILWSERLLEQFDRAAGEDPLSNPVHRLSYEFYRALASEALSLERLDEVAKAKCDAALFERAEDFARRRATEQALPNSLIDSLLAPLAGRPFADFRREFERTRAGVVFTAHPTFAMSAKLRTAFAACAGASDENSKASARASVAGLAHAPDANLTLADEHQAVQAAIVRAQNALSTLMAEMLRWARHRYPREWTALTPASVSIATWVGYDLDGRTDIQWSETFRLRLDEKSRQLRRYAESLNAIKMIVGAVERTALANTLTQAAEFAAEQSAQFAGDFSDTDIVTRAANMLTRDDPRRIVSLAPAIESIDRLVAGSDDEDARLALCLVRAEMKAFGLGVARIHLRINAAQVRSALRADLGLDASRDFIDRTSLAAAAKKAAATQSRRVNVASIFLEQMTARRQLMLCAEFIKHIDADTPIRFLIAECEAPATVMGAVYLAKLYGVDHRLDISPLFETPSAIERGGRFIERLLAEEEFVAYIRARGRLAIQLGFSDSGRFMGQVAANLAIERLQILLSRALAAKNIRDVEAVVFNTHGESMGRGGFPGSLQRRFDYLMTPWARARFQRDGIAANFESSFQGGDGFLHFETDAFAATTMAAMLRWSFAPIAADRSDEFYRDINYSWDFYRSLKAWQETLFENPDYHISIGAFAPRLLMITGSRRARRQAGAHLEGPRSLRAIPHNAILQQLAAPANVCGGVGAAAGAEPDRILDLIRNSGRAREIMALVRLARRLTSISVLRSYAAPFDAAFWVSKAAREDDAATAAACEELAENLAAHNAAQGLNRLANHLTIDLAKLDRVMRELAAPERRSDDRAARRGMQALHAIRQAMIMRAFLLVASVPAFSQRHDVSRASLFELAFELQFDALAELLEAIFPATNADLGALAGIEEPGDDGADQVRGYPEIHQRVIRPLREIHRSMREIGVGLSHYYGAYG